MPQSIATSDPRKSISNVGAWRSDPEQNELDPWQPKFQLARNETHGLPIPSTQTIDFTLIFTLFDSVKHNWMYLTRKVANGEKKRFTATFEGGKCASGCGKTKAHV